MASDFTWCDLWIYLYIYISSLLLHVPLAYLTVSHFLLWEKLLCKELTPASAETSTLGMAHTHLGGTKRENLEALVSKCWNLLILSKTTLLWGSCSKREKGGRALPSLVESHSSSPYLTPVPLTCCRITGMFHESTGTGILMLKERSEGFGL